MKFRKITSAFAAAALALSFGGCLKYTGDMLNTTVPSETGVSSQQETEHPNNTDESGVTSAGEIQTDANGSEVYVVPTTGTAGLETTTSAGSQTVTPNNPNTPDNPNTPNTPATTTPSSQNQTVPTVNGLDVLKSGNFYWKGRMQDENGVITPTEMASTKDSLYMSTSLNGANVALLMKNKVTYIIYPKIKGYMNMKLLMTASGIDDDMFDTSALDFSSLGNLADATSKKNERFNGKDCIDYVFTESGSTTEIFMSGNSFVGMRSTDSSGKTLSVMYVDYLTGNVPADKSAPPAGYTEYSGVKAISFMTELAKDMDIDAEN